jgi:putative ABC transport system permease protein
MMSIKNRELLFGIYRAMGMKMKEIRLMLVNEQIFSSILSIIAGGGVGALGTFLFVKLVALVYLPQKHNIPIHIYVYASDIIKLFAVVFVIVLLCIFVLRRMLQKMNIAQALKLGED